MAVFDLGETVICSIEVRDENNALQDPATSMEIKIDKTAPNYENIIAATVMINDSTGKYHYDYNSSSAEGGTYAAIYVATDGSRITIEKHPFQLQ